MIQKIIISISFALLVIIWPINRAFPLVSMPVTVDASQDTGVVSEVFRPGLMGMFSDNFLPLVSPVSDLNNKPFWRLHLQLGRDESSVKPANFDTNFKNWLKTTVDPALKQYQNSGYQIVISLSQVPKWLSLYPVNECMPLGDGCWLKWKYSPPKDYTAWNKLLKLLVTTQKQDGIKADYIIGDEPNWMFYGTEGQYLEMYKNSAKAIKQVDQNIKVGALGVGCWACTKDSNCPSQMTGLPDGECPVMGHSMIEGLIGYVSANVIPMDFIDWHFPRLDSFNYEVDTTRSWLKTYGLQQTLPLTIGEWVLSSKTEDEWTEKAASYAIYMSKALLDNGIYRHAGTSIYDQTIWPSGDWAHVGFFSNEGVIRAKWNAFKAVDRLPDRRLNVVLGGSESLVTAMAFKDAVRTSVIIASSVSPQQIALGINNLASGTYTVRKYLIDGDINEIHSNPCRYNKKTELTPSSSQCGVNGAIDQSVANAKIEAENITTSYMVSAGISQQNADNIFVCYKDPTCNLVNYLKSFYQKNAKAFNAKIPVLLEAQSLYNNLLYHGQYKVKSGKTYTITDYIDKINNFKEVSLEGSVQEKQVAVSNGTYSENISMQPYSVLLIELQH